MINYIVDLFSLVIEGHKTDGFDIVQSFKGLGEWLQNLFGLWGGSSVAYQPMAFQFEWLYAVFAVVFCISVAFILLRAFFGVFGLIRMR